MGRVRRTEKATILHGAKKPLRHARFHDISSTPMMRDTSDRDADSRQHYEYRHRRRRAPRERQAR